MRRAGLLAGALLVVACGPAVKSYKPDYVIEGRAKPPKYYFNPGTSTVRWVEVKYSYSATVMDYVVESAETSLERWELRIDGNMLTATHLPSGRTYKLKLNIPFPLTHVAVAKESGDILYVKEALEGNTYVIDPSKTNKEIGIIRRAYLYDDGIAIVGGERIRFCRDYDMRKCTTLYKLGKNGKFGKFFRANEAFAFYVEDYRWNDKEGGYRWLRKWFIVSPEGKVLWSTSHIDTRTYLYPFWEEADKQYVYYRGDYYFNPYYSKLKTKPPVHYEKFAPPAVYVKDGRVYYFGHGQVAGSLKSYTEAVMVENGKVKFRKRKVTNLTYASYALGFCSDKVVVFFDGIFYNPEDKSKVKCSVKVRELFSF